MLATSACGGAPTSSATHARAARSPLPKVLRQLNVQAKRGAVCETVAGQRVCDPFRSLEQDSPLTQRWIEAQTRRTAEVLARHDDPERRRRLRALLSIGSLEDARTAGGHLFFIQRDGEREQAALYMLDEADETPERIVDPSQLGERAALDWYYPSPSGRLVAYGVSHQGDERSTLYILNLATGERLPYGIEHTKWSHVSWLHDDSGFYYTRYPGEGDPGYDATQPDTYHRSLRFHHVGDDPSADPVVLEAREPTDFPWAKVSGDDRYVVVHNFRSWTASDVYLLDRGADAARRDVTPDEGHPLRPVIVGEPQLSTGEVRDGMLYLLTDAGAPKRRIVAAPADHAGDRSRWRDVVAEGPHAIEDWAVSGEEILVHTIEDLRSVLRAHPVAGGPARALPLPAAGSLGALQADPQRGSATCVFSGYFHPPTLLAYDAAQGRLTARHHVQADIDLSRYVLSRARVTSKDGTPIDIQYLHRRELERTGDHPVLLYGYGGFNVSLLPTFTRNAIYWLERGGIYAIANLRGGGERGEAWHRAGMLENKPRVFEDFEAAVRWFSDSGLSRPGRIALTGGSNGGLLVGALLTRAPETFGAAAAYVGLYDMLRYTRFPPAALWTSEYGDPADPVAARYLHAYSPYHQVAEGTPYPAVLIETADHDTRVHWSHSAKLAARLQQATAGHAPIYFFMERQTGHGQGTRLSDLVERYVRAYSFFEHALGMAGGTTAP